MKKPTLLLAILTLISFSTLLSQQFAPPIAILKFGKEAIATRTDGTEVEEFLIGSKLNKDSEIGMLKAKNAEGKKIWIPVEEIQSLRLPNSHLGQFFANNSVDNRKRAKMTNYDSLRREYLFFDQVILPSGNYALLQILNMGFDSKYKVYFDMDSSNDFPRASLSSPVTTTVGRPFDSYWVVKKGSNKAILVKRKQYRKLFLELFGDCPDLVEDYELKKGKPKWEDFARHIFYYDRECK